MIAGKRHAMGSPRLLAGLIVPLALVTLGVGAGPVPRSIRGSWVSGRCSGPRRGSTSARATFASAIPAATGP